MNYELPKPVREALARQMAHDAHPSADVLTAFAEQGLHHDERQRVIDHLAQCTECREVVFLASNAVEEPVGKEQELVAAAAATQVPRPAFTSVLAAGQVTPSEGRTAMPRRNRWSLWWVWAPAVAVVLIVSGIVLQKRSEFGGPENMTVAVKGLPPAPQRAPVASPTPGSENQLAVEFKATPGAESKAKPVTPKGGTKSQTAATMQAQNTEKSPDNLTLYAAKEPPPSPKALLAKPASPALPGAIPGMAGTAPVPTPIQNSFAESQAQDTTAQLFARPQTMRSVSGLRSQWRISTDGHLEHSTAPSVWSPVLADQPTTFHVVSVVGSNVWAGGSSGALFHSSDSGETWSKQALAGETGTIVSIHFSDAAHGIITTDGGARWITSDGGATWIKG